MSNTDTNISHTQSHTIHIQMQEDIVTHTHILTYRHIRYIITLKYNSIVYC